MQKVGNEGVITVEQAKSLETELDVVKGMQFDRGYVSPYFITNTDKMRVEMENPYVLVYEKKLSDLRELLPLLEALAQAGKPLLIIAERGRGRSTRHPRGQQAARPQGRGGESARLWRSAQGDAAGYRHSHRLHRHPGRFGHQA